MSEKKLCDVTKESSNEVTASTSSGEEKLPGTEADKDAGSDSESETSSTASEVRAPLELMGEFLLYVRQGSWEDAKKLCRMILIYEPENPEALQFLPMIEEKIQILQELAAEAPSESSSSEEEEESDDDNDGNDDDNEENDDDDESSNEDKTEHLKNKLIFPHKDTESTNIWKP